MRHIIKPIINGIAAGNNSQLTSENVHIELARINAKEEHEKVVLRISKSITVRIENIRILKRNIYILEQNQIDVINPGQDEQIDRRIQHFKKQVNQKIKEIELQKEILRHQLQKHYNLMQEIDRISGIHDITDKLVVDPLEKTLVILEDVIANASYDSKLQEIDKPLGEILPDHTPAKPSKNEVFEKLGFEVRSGIDDVDCEVNVRAHTREGYPVKAYTRGCPE